jgi:PKD repeat protein
MRILASLLLLLTFPAFAQNTTPPRQAHVTQTGTNVIAPVLDGTQPFTVTPNSNNTLTVTQGALSKTFPNSNALTAKWTGVWPKCPNKPPVATRIVQCPNGTQGTWTQTQDWLPHNPPIPPKQCWDIQPWQPTSPPAGSCPPIANQPPAANFAFSTNGLQVSFIDTSTDADGTIAARAWTFGDGGTATSSNPSHAYAVNGSYIVTLTVTDDDGAPGTKTQLVNVGTVVPPPGGLTVDVSYFLRSGNFYDRFVSYVNGSGASAEDLVYAWKLTGTSSYLTRAVAAVDAQVSAAEARIAAGQQPAAASDSYLGVDDYLKGLSLVYALGNPSDSQRARWKTFADQTIYNIWHPNQASWGGHAFPWSGWAIDDPENNYHYHFNVSSSYWALASGNASLIADMTNTHWPQIFTYTDSTPGGGSFEGTGYGSALRFLAQDMQTWKDSTGQDFAARNSFVNGSLLALVHGTVPTLDKFPPFGDQSRVSEPVLYDYHRQMGLRLYHLASDPAAIAAGGWWLGHISVQTMQASYNSRDNLIPYTVPSSPPGLTYRADETGQTFARTNWQPNATWLAVLMGRYDQSHAHQEQGSFTLYHNGWLAVTNNIWSHSGINQTTIDKNVIRFENGSSVVGQRNGRSVSVTSYTASANGDLHITGDLTPMYQSGVTWTRTLDFVAGALTVNDDLALGSGITPIWQVNVPTAPLVTGNVITTPGLRITVLSPASAQITVVDMRTVNVPGYGNDFQSGYRVDVKGSATNYRVKLEAL